MNETLPLTAVFDLDGTLTDTRHRNHLIETTPRKWEEFFAGSGEDPPHPEGLAALQAAAEAGCRIVYLSGRPERIRALSQDWLDRHECPAGDLLLRSDRNRSPAVDFKLRELRRLAVDHRLVVMMDDDPDIVEAIRRHRPPLVERVVLADWQPRRPSTPFETR